MAYPLKRHRFLGTTLARGRFRTAVPNPPDPRRHPSPPTPGGDQPRSTPSMAGGEPRPTPSCAGGAALSAELAGPTNAFSHAQEKPPGWVGPFGPPPSHNGPGGHGTPVPDPPEPGRAPHNSVPCPTPSIGGNVAHTTLLGWATQTFPHAWEKPRGRGGLPCRSPPPLGPGGSGTPVPNPCVQRGPRSPAARGGGRTGSTAAEPCSGVLWAVAPLPPKAEGRSPARW